MLWVLVFGGIAVVGLVVLVSYGIWLAHKTADVLSEVTVVMERLGAFGDLAAQIELPTGAAIVATPHGRSPAHGGLGSE